MMLIRRKSARNCRDKKEYYDIQKKYSLATKLNNAIITKKMSKPSVCEKCGDTGLIHGHHDDYSKPLEVQWLCVSCHRKLHAELRRQSK